MEEAERAYLDGVSSGEEDGGDAAKGDGEFYDDEYFDDTSESDGDQGAHPSRERKRVPKLTNEELLYDPEEDDRDGAWVQSKFGGGIEGVSNDTDALLSCPCCMTLLCVRCQQHDLYPTQYRAVFVSNCAVDASERLRTQPTDGSSPEVFSPVRCNVCRTEVGVLDADEVYHFFHVLASEP